MLDLFCGRWGWSKAFAARGWECVGVDLVEPPEVPAGHEFLCADVRQVRYEEDGFVWRGPKREIEKLGFFEFICASSPCEKFSVFGMKCFHPKPAYPGLGIELFNHTRSICEASGSPYVMENVRTAQEFVGQSAAHCGPFYLWGNAVPPILPQGITKGMKAMMGMLPDKLFYGKTKEEVRQLRRQVLGDGLHFTKSMKHRTAAAATIPPELSNCVAEYAERLIEQANHFEEKARHP